jgi:hypothetical protein
MLQKANNSFANLPEPDRSCLLYLRELILDFSSDISESWKFNTPFYYYKGKWLCFISYDKKTRVIYVSMVNGYKITHPKLLSEGRKKMKIFYVDAEKDTDVKSLKAILRKAVVL